MNEVTVTVLPHPITMFMLGGMLLGLILLFSVYLKNANEVKEYKREIQKLTDNIENSKVDLSKAVNEISRKVDSRIDKALGSVKK
jgi:predicted DNA-binding ArsR family transcriptional regulator